MLFRRTMRRRFLDFLAKDYNLSRAELESRLDEDADSLDLVELVMEIEEEHDSSGTA